MAGSSGEVLGTSAAAREGVETDIMANLGRLRHAWSTWSLARQFATCASIVLLPAMTLIGLWVGSRIQQSVTHGAATSAALHMENFVEPLVQELAVGQSISAVNVARLSRLLQDTALGQRILTFKIWVPGDVVAASSRTDLIGQKFLPSAGLLRAWKGDVVSEFDHLKDVENQYEKDSGIPLLEVYIPIRVRGSDAIIAVGEFYEKADDLKATLVRAQLGSWLVVGGVTMSMLLALFAIVRRGSQTIELQRANLEQRVTELTSLLAENRQLRARAQSSSARASESNEGYLRRLGADLHDGPAQLISLALLRLDDGRPRGANDGACRRSLEAAVDSDALGVRQVLIDALKEIRTLAAGLAVPEIDGHSLKEAIATAIVRHELITGSRVTFDSGDLPKVVAPALKLCAYRFVQEGLTNAYRHAGGVGQVVEARLDDQHVVVKVVDRGGGMPDIAIDKSESLGLRGLRNRIESIGGALQIETGPDRGTCLTARLPTTTGVFADA